MKIYGELLNKFTRMKREDVFAANRRLMKGYPKLQPLAIDWAIEAAAKNNIDIDVSKLKRLGYCYSTDWLIKRGHPIIMVTEAISGEDMYNFDYAIVFDDDFELLPGFIKKEHIAHEFGHILNGDFDKEIYYGDAERHSAISNGTVSEHEIQADKFAMSILSKEEVIGSLKCAISVSEVPFVINELTARIKALEDMNI